jgi:hypothetical protein
MLVQETTTSWTYALAAFRQANASATNQLDMVIGVRENIVSARVITSLTSAASTNQGIVGIGIDATNANSADLFSLVTTQVANVWTPATAYYVGYPGIGRHFLAWVESSPSTATMSFNGNQSSTHSGISGELLS